MRVEATDAAEADLEEIADWISRDNPGRGLIYLRELRARCESLSTHPERFQLVDRYRSASIRRAVHGAYLIFYEVGIDRVTILRVLHGARDYEPLIFPSDRN
ncbi:MAG TPA: type II toxin-antitoxin system RelE/ParE family toxin [Caulobacteraceae bacterium]|nr:type II toxin-antitoxin system RelE/ParE family toxin [Caulobacteraceae bacterium]